MHNDDRILLPGTKVVVTELGLDDWICQQYGYDFEHLPRHAPLHMPKEIYEDLKKKYYKYTKAREMRPISAASYKQLYPCKQTNITFEADLIKMKLNKSLANKFKRKQSFRKGSVNMAHQF